MNTCTNLHASVTLTFIGSVSPITFVGTEPVFKDYHIRGGEVSEYLFNQGLCLPSGTAMTEEDLKRVVDVIRDASVNKT